MGGGESGNLVGTGGDAEIGRAFDATKPVVVVAVVVVVVARARVETRDKL